MNGRSRFTLGGLVSLALLAATPTFAAATTWLVPGNGSNTCTRSSPNCNTIAQAVTASSSGDTIQIGAGTFPVQRTSSCSPRRSPSPARASASTFVQPAATGFSVRTSNIVLQRLHDPERRDRRSRSRAHPATTRRSRASTSAVRRRAASTSRSAATFTVTNVAITDCTLRDRRTSASACRRQPGDGTHDHRHHLQRQLVRHLPGERRQHVAARRPSRSATARSPTTPTTASTRRRCATR